MGRRRKKVENHLPAEYASSTRIFNYNILLISFFMERKQLVALVLCLDDFGKFYSV